MAEPPLLRLAGVHTHIGRYHILHGVDLTVAEGEVSVLLGRNGAGKTTTLRSIMGLWRVSRGAIDFAGQPIAARATPDIARLGIAYVPENMGVFSGLTVAENFRLATPSGRFEPQRLARVMRAFPVLEQKWQVRAGTLSGGQKQMLAIGRAIIAERRLLIIDEPSKGLAPVMVGQLLDALLALKRARTTILLVEQNFFLARALGDRVAVMDDGRIVHTGTMAALAEDVALQSRLLGLSLESHQ
jgi:branched-chain amino acid transport system ATP-binding protein|uniref:ABC transporter ATP-binding protein n=1 Tax=Acidicaldus sp. TaxID=1872105 RepID=A0A8J4HC11_9PROT